MSQVAEWELNHPFEKLMEDLGRLGNMARRDEKLNEALRGLIGYIELTDVTVRLVEQYLVVENAKATIAAAEEEIEYLDKKR